MPNVSKSNRARAQSRARGFSLSQFKGDRWRCKVELPPRDGKRRATSKVFDSREAAEVWGMETALSVRTGTHLDRAPDSFASVAEQWLTERAQAGTRPITLKGYRTKLTAALEAFGDRRVQEISRPELKKFLRSRAHLGISSVRQELYCIRSVFALALEDGLLATNPAVGLKAAGKPAEVRRELSDDAARLIAEHVHGDRLEVLWHLSLAGLRRSEVMALRWSDFDLASGTVTVQAGRTAIEVGDSTTPPKSARSRRTLPLLADLSAALRRTRKIRQSEVLALGAPWDSEQLVAVDEALNPIRPELYSEWWGKMLASLGLEPITLHGARHGSVTRLLNAGVPVHQVQAWHGHANASQTLAYAHASVADLRAAAEAVAAH